MAQKAANTFGVRFYELDLEASPKVVRVEVALEGGRPGSSAAKAGKLPGWTVAVGREEIHDAPGAGKPTIVQVIAYRAPRTQAELDACVEALRSQLKVDATETGA